MVVRDFSDHGVFLPELLAWDIFLFKPITKNPICFRVLLHSIMSGFRTKALALTREMIALGYCWHLIIKQATYKFKHEMRRHFFDFINCFCCGLGCDILWGRFRYWLRGNWRSHLARSSTSGRFSSTASPIRATSFITSLCLSLVTFFWVKQNFSGETINNLCNN